jgi:hypothetical protein
VPDGQVAAMLAGVAGQRVRLRDQRIVDRRRKLPVPGAFAAHLLRDEAQAGEPSVEGGWQGSVGEPGGGGLQ